MSFDVDEDAIVAQAAASYEAENPPVVSDAEPLAAEPAAPAEAPTEPAKAPEQAEPSNATPPRPPVPYERLQKVVSERNSLRAEIESLRQSQKAPSPPVEEAKESSDIDRIVDELMGKPEKNPDLDALRQEIADLKGWRKAEETAAYQAEVNQHVASEFEAAKVQFPTVNPDDLAAAIVENPRLSFAAAAKQLLAEQILAGDPKALERYVPKQTPATVPEKQRPHTPTRPASMTGANPPAKAPATPRQDQWPDEEAVLASLGIGK